MKDETHALIVSVFGTAFAWITIDNVQIIATLTATIVSIVAGLLAIYIYVQKIKKK